MKNTYSYKDIFENFSTFFLVLMWLFLTFLPFTSLSKAQNVSNCC